MIAEVIPFLRLPRRFEFFDYLIPDSMEVGVGDLVRIPFHGREVLGVVRGITLSSTERKLSPLRDVALREWATMHDVSRLERIAGSIGQSPSNIFHLLSPKPHPGSWSKNQSGSRLESVRRDDVTRVQELLKNPDRQQAICGDFEFGTVLVHALRKTEPHQILVLVPTERDAEQLAGSDAVLHGHTKPAMRDTIMHGWRNGSIRLLVGTRSAVLLPAKKISAIIVLEAGNDEHMSTRRNPRFDAREAAKLLAHDHDAHLFFVDPLPRLEEHEHGLENSVDEPPQVVSLKNPLEKTEIELVTSTVFSAISDALLRQKNVVLFLNRKGVAKRLQCGACGHIPLCGTCGSVPNVRHDDLICAQCGTEMWIPERCPGCGKNSIKLRGVGGAKVAEGLKKAFPHATVGTIEKGNVFNPDASILLVTEFYFSSFLKRYSRENIGLVVDLSAEIGLSSGDFRSAEKTARKLSRLRHFATRYHATCLIQTWLPDLIAPLLQLPAFTEQEQKTRKRFHLPPFVARYILEKTAREQLPDELKPYAFSRDTNLELRIPELTPETCRLLKTLPDTVKILPDTSYVRHERPPQPE